MPSKSKKANSQINAAKPQPVNKISSGTSSNGGLRNAGVPPPVPNVANGQNNMSKADPDLKTGDTTESAGEPNPAPTVNRKKQKRREKEAAKRAAEKEFINGHIPEETISNGQLPPNRQGRGPKKGYFTEEPDVVESPEPSFHDVGSPEDAFYSGDEGADYGLDVDPRPDSSWLNTSKRKKNSKKKGNPMSSTMDTRDTSALSRPQGSVASNSVSKSGHKPGRSDKIWNTSTQAERENIKQFWLDLGEEERRSLVKVEKEAVLRKMKEQQKHSCSCSVCGRKRTAIEEELEVLYDAYYEELEQFANHNSDLTNAPQLIAPPRPSYRRLAPPMAGSYPSRGRVHEIREDDEDIDDDGEYDDDDEPYSDEDEDDEEDLDEHGLPPGPPDFFQFGNSLTVKDGILTVADDLLKNDGRHFIDMMEQLAERRMQREEEIHYPASALAHQNLHEGHNHPPLDDDDDFDDEDDDEEYDSQDEDDFEGDDMDSMTEEQRMEEGRRMFQIFAARMFEQRVLTAYREKVAAERQRKLLEELDEELRLDTQREAKKAREAAKKKEKKKLQKQAKEEEKAKKDAEKAAQEAAAREVEEKRLEEQRLRKEEQKKKREAEKKAVEDERLRKEAEKLRKAQEERERQAEAERKQREAKERERKKRDELRKKEREEREAKDREVKERKTKEEKDRKAKEENARKETDAAPKPDKEAKDRAAPVPTQQPRAQPVALPPGLLPNPRGSQVQSPHFQVATPIVPPKIPTPGRNRQTSQPGLQSHGSSPRSQKASTEISQSSVSPASVVMPQTPAAPQATKSQGQPPMLHHPQPSAPRSPLNNQTHGQYPFNMNGLQGLGMTQPPPNASGMMPGRMPPGPFNQAPPMGSQPRYPHHGMQYPPGFAGPRPFQPSQNIPFNNQGPMSMSGSLVQNPVPKAQAHSRQPSGNNNVDLSGPPAPIARPGPIGRPSSTTPDKQKPKQTGPDPEMEQLTAHLGSKALLDEGSDPFPGSVDGRSSYPPVGPPGSLGPPAPSGPPGPPGPPGSSRMGFSHSYSEPKSESFGLGGQGWSGFSAGMPGAPGWGPPPTQRGNASWSQPSFGAIGGPPQPIQRSHLPRPIAVRQLMVQVCRQLSSLPGGSPDGFHPIQTVLRQVDSLMAPNEPPVPIQEMLLYSETEGNLQNGGGSFEIISEGSRGQIVKFVEDATTQPRSSVGDIGSPVPNHNQMSHFGGIGQGFGPPGRSF